MSWTRILATGSGELNLRLQIEGFPYEAVTDRGMEGTASDGRIRYAGLSIDRFTLKERVDLVRSKWEPQGFRVSIVDRQRIWTDAFAKKPTAVTFLDSDATAGATTFTVKNAGNPFATSGTIYVDTETVGYSSVSTSGLVFQGLSRAKWQSLAQKHYTVSGANQRYPEVTNWPRVREGRRVRLYAYGAGDDLTDASATAGTLIWLGVVQTEPTFDGMYWSFGVDPITRKWDSDIGGQLEDPMDIRGIYYPYNAPLFIAIREWAAPPTVSVSGSTELAVYGFWETQEEFLEDLNSYLATATASPLSGTITQTVIGRSVGTSWVMEYEADGSTPVGMEVHARSAVDMIGGRPLDADTGIPLDDFRAPTAGARYRYRQNGALGQVPRATLGRYRAYDLTGLPAANRFSPAGTGVANVSQYKSGRVYVSGNALPAATTAVAIDWQSNGVAGLEPQSGGFTKNIATINTANRYFEVFGVFDERPGGPVIDRFYSAVGSGNVEIRLGLTFTRGDLQTFLTDLTGDTPEFLNAGVTPDVRAGDFTAFASTELPEAIASKPLAQNRQYTLFSPVSFAELLEQDCRIAGVFPAYNTDGTVTFRKLRHAAQSEVASVITGGDIITGEDGWLVMEQSANGQFHTVELNTYWDAVEEEYRGPRQVVRDVEAFGRNPDGRVLEISPKSRDGRAAMDPNAVLASAIPVLSVFGAPYSYLTIQVTLRHFSVLLGDVVSITWDKVPDSDGTLGVSGKRGIVVGREWDLGDGTGKLTIMLTDLNIAGYTPAAKISGAIAGASGTTGPFSTTLPTDYFPSGTNAADHWNTGDLIRLFRYDDTNTSTNKLGTVTSVIANAVTWTTTGNWTHAGSTWVIGSRTSTELTATSQKTYAFVAKADGTVDYSSDLDNEAYVFL